MDAATGLGLLQAQLGDNGEISIVHSIVNLYGIADFRD